MDLLYYTHTAFFEPALCLVRELSTRATVHLLLEVSATAWETAGFDLGPVPLPAGLVPADAVLGVAVPPGVRAYWRNTASFHLVVHSSRRSLHPASWRVSRQVLRFAVDRGADVLHIDDVDVSPRLPLALPFAQSPPIVISAHDPEPHSGERDWRKTFARRMAYPRARKFVLYNAAMRQTFARRYGVDDNRVVTTRLGIYDVLREWAPAPVERDAATVLFFGRLSPYKALDVFYESARLIAGRVPRARFVVAGRPITGYTPPPAPAIDGVALDVISRYVNNAELGALLRRATVVVCPYREATQSGVVLTAFAFGVPVVATRVGGLPEYVTHEQTGLLVPSGDGQAVADAVCRILLDHEFAARLRHNIAAAAADTLSWRATADALMCAYAGASART